MINNSSGNYQKSYLIKISKWLDFVFKFIKKIGSEIKPYCIWKVLAFFSFDKINSKSKKNGSLFNRQISHTTTNSGFKYNGIMLLKSITRILTKYKHMRKNFFPEIMICSPLKQVAKFFLCCLLLLILQNVWFLQECLFYNIKPTSLLYHSNFVTQI